VKVPPDADGPVYARHNHCPALTVCPNGDLLAIWYSTRREPGRELGIVGSRLRHDASEWEDAAPFWDAADRNDHASALHWDGQEALYHFNGLSTDATWRKLALILRTSTDNGATWSKARLINPNHGLRNMPIANVFATRAGAIVLPCDAVTGGAGGSVVHVSRDNGATWSEQSGGRRLARYEAGAAGPAIAGIHACAAELDDGRLLAFGRGDNIGGFMPASVSEDLGRTWTYSASPFPPISGGQRPVLLRLDEGPLFFASFTPGMDVQDAAGKERRITGLFAALSFDEGETWPVRKLISDYRPDHEMDGGGNTRRFIMGPEKGEPRGYLVVRQTPDGVIHLLSSALHYRFNTAWLREAMPPAP
jgi:formylglycine-generating enzyme